VIDGDLDDYIQLESFLFPTSNIFPVLSAAGLVDRC
jgi:hypothetical protein